MNEQVSAIADVVVNTTYVFKAIQPVFRKDKVVSGKLYSWQEGKGTSDERLHLRNLDLSECPAEVVNAKPNTSEIIIYEEKHLIGLTPLFDADGNFDGARLYSQQISTDRISGEVITGKKENIRIDRADERPELLKELALRDGEDGSLCESKHLKTYGNADFLLTPVRLKGKIIGAKLFFNYNSEWRICGFMLKPDYEKIIDNSTIPAEELRRMYLIVE